jgi:hypothetical protein
MTNDSLIADLLPEWATFLDAAATCDPLHRPRARHGPPAAHLDRCPPATAAGGRATSP